MISTLFFDDILNEKFADLISLSNPASINYKKKPAKNRILQPSLKKEKNNIVLTVPAMGLSEKDISMSIEDKYLTVKSECDDLEKPRSEINYSIYIGDDIVKEESKATLEKGILAITIPVKEDKKLYQISF